jgi:predicted cobalt transporter CbtA
VAVVAIGNMLLVLDGYWLILIVDRLLIALVILVLVHLLGQPQPVIAVVRIRLVYRQVFQAGIHLRHVKVLLHGVTMIIFKSST